MLKNVKIEVKLLYIPYFYGDEREKLKNNNWFDECRSAWFDSRVTLLDEKRY